MTANEPPGAGWRLETRAVHAGERARPGRYIATSTPIYRSATFLYETAEEFDAVFGGEASGFTYSRLGNPTVAAAEAAVAALEGAQRCVAFTSGMAALHAALLATGLGAGDRIVAALGLYATTYTLLNSVLRPLGVAVDVVDLAERGALPEALARGSVRAVLVETLSNPLLRVADLPALADAAHAAGAALIADATFTPPPLAAPLAHGADIVIHSATKYLGGHADLTAGVAYGSGAVAANLEPLAGMLGSRLAPNEAWLLLRGLKTLPLRLRQQCLTARRLARFLATHPRVEHVHFPGLPTHPHHDLAGRLFRRGWYGAVISLALRDAGRPEILRFLNALRLCLPTTSLGDIYTLVSCPAMASHRELSPRMCRALGITPNLIRLSVGIEHPADLMADLGAALDQIDIAPAYVPAHHAERHAAADEADEAEAEEPAP